MKLTNKEHEAIRKDTSIYEIKYVTPHGSGVMTIKKSFWEKCQRKFDRAFKDVVITSIKEIKI